MVTESYPFTNMGIGNIHSHSIGLELSLILGTAIARLKSPGMVQKWNHRSGR